MLAELAKIMQIKSIDPKWKQSGITRELRKPCSTLQRYRKELKMISPYKNPTLTEENKNHPTMTPNWPPMTSKRPQMTSKWPQKKMIKLFLKK